MGPFRVVRPADMLVADIGLVNLRSDGSRLVRREPAAPTLILVGLPPQHILEEVVPQQVDGTTVPLATVRAFTSGATQLVFSVPPEVDSLELSLESLLDWERLVPMTVPVVRPGTTPAELLGSVIEFPTRLLLTYDEPVNWACPPEPRSADGRTGVWHALLSGERGGDALLRALARADDRPSVPARFPLTTENLADLVTLTSRTELIDAAGAPIPLPSAPLRAEQFIATPLGASAHLHGAWEDMSPGAVAQLESIDTTWHDLAAYDHITGLGRDQFVRVVTRGFLSTGHPALLVSEVKRLFVAHKDEGIVAHLRREDRIVLREPEVRYGENTGFAHQGREMPFTELRVTDRVTPLLRTVWPRNAKKQPEPRQAFWIELQDGVHDHQFTVLATDREGRKVSFTMPLVFVPASRAGNWEELRDRYSQSETGVRDRVERSLGGQVMAMAQPPADAPGSTSHAVGRLKFEMTRKTAGGEHPLAGTLVVSGADVRVPALEPFAPKAGDVPVTFNHRYRDHGMAAHPARAYLDLVDAIGLEFASESVGGLARPDAGVKVITSQAGVVPDVFGNDPTAEIRNALGAAKLLGFIDLGALLGPIAAPDLDRLKQLGDREIQALLDDAGGTIPAPVLRVRDLADGAGKELRYVWKTRLEPPRTPPGAEPFPLDVNGAVLTLDARTVVSKDAGNKTSVEGRLRDIALQIAGVVRVEIADLRFRSVPGSKPDVSASGLEMRFLGDLRFIDTLRSALPADAFGSGAFVDVQPWGIRTGYALALPAIGVGVFSLANVCLKTELIIPFDADKVISFRFSVSERQRPFNVTVSLFGGGGYFSMLVDAEKGIREAEGAIEFGGAAALNLGVASGGVTVMAGVRFELRDGNVTVGGYLRCSGFLTVLGIVTVSVEFYLELTYEKNGSESVVRGRGTLTVSVTIAFFSKSVSLSLERSFSGAPGDPTFVDCFDRETHWEDYCLGFDGEP
ncbi:hypothetical protein [Streptomyces marokkonensis]|uniref:hypothetical protein n=1 Tax=Streptomyces marokkonensis TaxID=324855 RepID=UPI001AD769C2|nr:hypothetical protein [Streptomyces marokkonensis]